jgi:hypothetical protein
MHPHGVAATDLTRWMHQAVCQFAIRGKQEQARCCDIEPANGNPAHPGQFRQGIKYEYASFGVAAAGHLPRRLVVLDVPVSAYADREQ